MRKTENDALGRATLEAYRNQPKNPVVLVADNIRSLNNVGSLFRSCDAFAVTRLILCGITATPPSRDIHKTALGAELSVEWSYFRSTAEAVKELKQAGWRIAALEQAEGATMLNEFHPEPETKYAVIVGNEVDGVSQEVIDLCDLAIEIPQYGTKHSLNVAVAAGIVLWQMTGRKD